MSKNLFEQARGAKSAKELLSLAKTAGVEMGEEQAEHLFGQLNRSGELADDELDSVAGGGCNNKEEDGLRIGDNCTIKHHGEIYKCGKCGSTLFTLEGGHCDCSQIIWVVRCTQCQSEGCVDRWGGYIVEKA